MAVEAESLLHWNAFLYVTGELDAEATIAFERILLEDQSAREAVAAAVELIQVVGRIPPDSERILSIPRRSRRSRLIAAISVVAAAAAVVASALIPAFRSPSNVDADPSRVARTWSGLRGGIDADWKAVVSGSTSVDPVDSPLLAENDAVVEGSGERPLPSWLLSAASAPRVESPQEEN